MKLDRKYSHTEYELKFYVGGTEYEYDINAETGEVLKFSREVKNHGAPQNAGNAGLIGEAKARGIVAGTRREGERHPKVQARP